MEAKESKRFVVYFPSAGDIQPLPRNLGFSTPTSCSGEGGGRMLGRQCQGCSEVAKALLCYQHLSSHQDPAQRGEWCCGEKNPSQPDPIHLYIRSSGARRYMKDVSIEFPLSKEEPGGLTQKLRILNTLFASGKGVSRHGGAFQYCF